MVLSILFGWEGFKMVRWAHSKNFTGGCCDDCRVDEPKPKKDPELGTTADEKCDCCASSENGSCGGSGDDIGRVDTKVSVDRSHLIVDLVLI